MGAATRFSKALQRGTYTLLNSKWGALLVLMLAMTLLNVAMQIVDSALGAHWVCMETEDDADDVGKFSNNIGGRSFERELCEEPIDAVYTWVNGSEPHHQLEVAFWQLLQRREGNNAEDWLGGGGEQATATTEPNGPPNATSNRSSLSAQQLDDQSSRSRFEDHDELKYSLRSLEKYAGWVRHVYLVTNGQIPTWLNVDHPRITVVTHAEIFQNASHLPTFSSPAIESHLHRIPGLSRRFLYLNDDTMFGAPVVPTDFYSKTKGHRLFYSWPVPQCSDGCPAAWLGDGTCDRQCNTTACDYDAGDCIGPNVKVLGNHPGHAAAPPSRGTPPKQSNVHCHSNCADGWLGDRYCDASCNHRDCGYDGLDCGLAPFEADAAFMKFAVPWERPSSSARSSSSNGQRMRRSTNHSIEEQHEAATVSDVQTQQAPRPMPTRTSGVKIHHHIRVDVEDAKSFLVNLSAVFPQGSLRAKILSGEFDTPSWVRAVTIAQGPRLMVVSIVQEWDRFAKMCQFLIEGEREVDALGASQEASELAARIARRVDMTDVKLPKAADGTTSAPAVQVEMLRVTIVLNITLFNGSYVAHRDVAPSVAHSSATKTQLLVDAESSGEEADTVVDEAASTVSVGHRLMQAAIDSAERAAAWRPLLAWDNIVDEAEEGEDESTVGSTSSRNDQLRRLPSSPTQRRLMDLFGDSLKHTNMLMTRRFKSSSRRVPAHMVHMIDKQVMEELWDAWPEEWQATSASKFRSRSNLQYAFMHYYWMVHASITLSGEDVFRRFVDVDGSGAMEVREVRRVALMLWEKEVAHGPLDMLAMGIVEGCERILRQEQLGDENGGSGGAEGVASNHSESGGAASPGPTPAPPYAMGEERNSRVCRQLWRVPGTEGFFRKLHPQPPPPATTLRDEVDILNSSPPLSTQEPSGTTAGGDGIVHEHTTRNHSFAHRGRGNRTVHHQRSRAPPPQQQDMHQQPPVPVGLAGSSSRLPPVPAPYRVPSVNPEDKIRPMTVEYLRTVQWLLRAAAIGVALHGKDVPQDDNGTGWPPACSDSSPFSLSSLNATAPGCIHPSSELGRDVVSDPVPLTARTFATSHVGAIVSEKYGTIRKYKVAVEELEDVTFVMVRNNRTVVRHQMDHVLFKRPKFLCVNDDMNHSSPDYGQILETVDDMFRSYYPHPSQFELPDGRRNEATRLSGAAEEAKMKSRNAQREEESSVGSGGWRRRLHGRLTIAAGCILLAIGLLYACLTSRGVVRHLADG